MKSVLKTSFWLFRVVTFHEKSGNLKDLSKEDYQFI